MPMSVILDGEVLDWHFKRIIKDRYLFCIGHIQIGQIHKWAEKSWTAISYKNRTIGPVSGFNSRYKTGEFLLKLYGIGDWKDLTEG